MSFITSLHIVLYINKICLALSCMTKLGYWASQEQYSMNDLIKFVIEAEKMGFDQTLTSDHFHPWSHTNGHGNFTWVWLAAPLKEQKK